MFLVPVNGSFKNWSGVINIDVEAPAKSLVEVEIDLASVDTGFGLMAGFGMREWHIRHGHYLGVARYPKARFVSTDVRLNAGKLEIDGTLDLHGVTRPITLKGNMELDSDKRRVFRAGAVLDRYDYNITMGKIFEGFGYMVGNLVTLNIEVALER